MRAVLIFIGIHWITAQKLSSLAKSYPLDTSHRQLQWIWSGTLDALCLPHVGNYAAYRLGAIMLKAIVLSLFAFVSINASAVCTAYCKPGKSYACGGGCISIYKLCRKPTTTACNGERPPEATKHYKTPKHVEPKAYGGGSDAGADETTETDGVE